MQFRTDLAEECLDFAKEIMPEGVEKEIIEKNGAEVTRVKVISEEGARIIGKGIGEYLTINTGDFKAPPARYAEDVEVVAELLSSLIKTSSEQPVLVVGLGNAEITPDALGPRAIHYTLATRHISKDMAKELGFAQWNSVAALAVGVLGQTGVETSEIVESVVREIKPSCVIVIDALAAKSIDRLGSTVQISNTGISPGSGVQNRRKELSEATLGVPVISVGVPMVVDMTTIAYELLGEGFSSEKVSDKGRSMIVTPREIDQAIEHAAKTVAYGINRALHPSLSLEELSGLVG